MAAVVEIPPERCSQCPQTRLRPTWGECPEPRCRRMCRIYDCANGHITVAPDHEHRVIPAERPRWHCQAEGGPQP